MIFIAGISIALFISALLLVKKNKSKADYFLILWMILNAIHLSFHYLLFSETIYDYPHLLGIQFPMPLLHGVLLYYYVASVTNQFPKTKIVALIHLLPTIGVLLFLIPFFLSTAPEKIEVFKSEGKGYETFQTILVASIFLSGIIYVIWSSLLLRKHKKQIRDQFSSLEEINLKWLQFLVYGLGAVWLLVIFTQNDNLIFIGASVFVIFVGFFGIQQKNIFNTVDASSIPSQTKTNKEKYASSGLSQDQSEKLFVDLNQLIENKAVYKQQELSIGDLAKMLNTHPNYLSQIINKKTGRSFYDFINTFRVEACKKMMEDPESKKFTLLSLAYESGFNSKSSFNRYFKKSTGLTPTQYLNSLK